MKKDKIRVLEKQRNDLLAIENCLTNKENKYENYMLRELPKGLQLHLLALVIDEIHEIEKLL